MARHFQLGCLLLFATVMATPTDREGKGYLSCTEGSCAHADVPGRTRSRTVRSANQFVILQMRGHRSACTPAETKKAACLNGVCYSLSLAYMRSPFCECPEKYEGARCEQLSLDYYLIFMSSSSMVKGLIIGGVFFILLIIIIIISVCCHKWKKRKRQRLQEMKNPDSEEGRPLSAALPPPQLKGNVISKVFQRCCCCHNHGPSDPSPLTDGVSLHDPVHVQNEEERRQNAPLLHPSTDDIYTPDEVPQARKAEQEEYLTENGSTGVEMIELEHLNSTSNNISSRSEPQVS